jgi:hypothetical protein
MKPRILLLSFIILIILIVMSFLMSREGAKNQPIQDIKAIPQEPAMLLEQTQQLPFSDGHKSIIAITKEAPEIKPQELAEKKTPPASAKTDKHISATGSTATGQSPKPPSSNQTEESVVKISKEPSKEEIKEMRARGIVLF